MSCERSVAGRTLGGLDASDAGSDPNTTGGNYLARPPPRSGVRACGRSRPDGDRPSSLICLLFKLAEVELLPAETPFR